MILISHVTGVPPHMTFVQEVFPVYRGVAVLIFILLYPGRVCPDTHTPACECCFRSC